MPPLNRREFLAGATLGVAASSLATSSLGANQAAPSGMFISLPPWAVARNVGWPEQARLAARVGYQGIDWAFAPARQAGVAATRALLAELRITPTICNLPMTNALGGDDDAFAAQVPTLDENAAFAAAIGCRRFQQTLGAAVPAGQTREQRWTTVRSRLSVISGILARHDLRLGIEFLGPLVFRAGRVPFVYTLKEAVALSTEAGPNIGATLDAWHWYHSGGTPADILATDPARIVHVHVSDAREMPPEQVQDNMRWLPGEGVIDLVGFFQALRTIGWRGGVAPETIGPRIPDAMAPEDSARQALDATTAVMTRAGVL